MMVTFDLIIFEVSFLCAEKKVEYLTGQTKRRKIRSRIISRQLILIEVDCERHVYLVLPKLMELIDFFKV